MIFLNRIAKKLKKKATCRSNNDEMDTGYKRNVCMELMEGITRDGMI
jgi:hypothetical protein